MIEAEPGVDGLEDSVATEGVTDGLDMETDRSLCDDGKMWLLRPTADKTQDHRRVEGRTATGRNARSHMRQGGRAAVRNWIWTSAGTECLRGQHIDLER